tara:strand:- start:693 stop:1166 length:474 start_codon:yes stop_codon:yes gene_type:complete
MTSATSLVILVLGVLSGLIGLFLWLYFRPGKDNTIMPGNPLGNGTMIVDFVNGFTSRVLEIRFRDDRDDVVLDNGRIINYDKSLLRLLNPSQVLAGKPATFTYGITPEQDKTEIVKKYRVMKDNYLLDKARASEVRLREQQLVKDIVKKASGKVSEK